MFGQLIKAFGSFGSPQIQASTGVPPFYPLAFYEHSYLGIPFYHFRSDWTKATNLKNFTTKNGQVAQVGDKVEVWKNTYLGVGQGDATVPPVSMNGGNYWGKEGYPTLVERSYGSTKYTGLQFTGTEYFEIDGGTVTQAYNPPGPIFSTGGTNLMTYPYSKTGASFLFVVHSDMHEPVTNPTVDGLQSLLYSRPYHPHVVHGPPPGYTWPTNVEDYGIQVWFQGWNADLPPNTAVPALGPNICQYNTDAGFFPMRPKPNPNPPPNCTWWCGLGFGAGVLQGGGHVGVDPGTVTTRCPPTFGGAAKILDGFQVLLFEFDNTAPYDRTWPGGQGAYGLADGSGMLMRYYTFGNSAYTQTINFPMPGMSNSLSHPRSCASLPGAPNRILFNSKIAFLGGMPPCPSIQQIGPSSGWPQAHGFRGTIFEVMMFEGLLSRGDRKHLEALFAKKYQAAIT